MDEKKVRDILYDLVKVLEMAEEVEAETLDFKNIPAGNLEVVIEALEKQLPKKLAEHHYEEPGEVPYVKYGCGNGCRIQPARSSKYCNQCGQRIDWSE